MGWVAHKCKVNAQIAFHTIISSWVINDRINHGTERHDEKRHPQRVVSVISQETKHGQYHYDGHRQPDQNITAADKYYCIDVCHLPLYSLAVCP